MAIDTYNRQDIIFTNLLERLTLSLQNAVSDGTNDKGRRNADATCTRDLSLRSFLGINGADGFDLR